MQETSTSPAAILQFRQDIEAQFRQHIREAIEVSLTEELAAALGSHRHERTDDRRGYRNGTTERTVTTSEGTRRVNECAKESGRGCVPSLVEKAKWRNLLVTKADRR